MFDSSVDIEHAFGHAVGMSRTRVRRRRTALTAAAAVLVAILVGPVGHALEAGAAVRHPRTVVVRSGDTLWSVAERVRPGSDPRAVVDAIVGANAVDAGALAPGTRLVVPQP
jgi:hypothetical protein